MRETRSLLLGQNVTPRHRPRRWVTFLVPFASCWACFALGVAMGISRGASSHPWPPAHLKLVPAIERPQGTVTAFVRTDGNWLVNVIWEPIRPDRLLGVEPPKDSDSCTVHVAAEMPYPQQLAEVQKGVALCFAATFTRKAGDDGE